LKRRVLQDIQARQDGNVCGANSAMARLVQIAPGERPYSDRRGGGGTLKSLAFALPESVVVVSQDVV
jgi:hypothetical protein